jgi:peptide-methionine (S)-S-oxide reductase
MRLFPTYLGIVLAILIASPAGIFAAEKQASAIFAGGCFWCMEGPYDEIDGVISTTSGYTDGHLKNPNYQQVSSGSSGHTEALKVVYDPAKVSYNDLLKVFWVNIDPLTANAQFCDHGSQYRSGIYYQDNQQKQAALDSLENIKTKFKQPVVTEIKMATTFYPAEDYHQDYYVKNPVRYKYYRWRCGRDARLQELWGTDAPKVH